MSVALVCGFQMEWCNEEVLEFLDLYEQEPVIWDPRHKNYQERNEVNDAWKRIQSRFSIDIPLKLLKRKRNSLMATFRKVSLKVARTGDAECQSQVYKPKWFPYEKMVSFLDRPTVYTPKPTTRTTEVEIPNIAESPAKKRKSNTEPIVIMKTESLQTTTQTDPKDYDNTPSIRINPNPQHNDTPSTRINTNPQHDNTPTGTNPNPSDNDNTPSIRINPNPQHNNTPSTRINTNPQHDNTPTGTNPNPSDNDNTPSIRINPNPQHNNTPSTRINPNPQHDITPSTRINPNPQHDITPSTRINPNPQHDITHSTRINPNPRDNDNVLNTVISVLQTNEDEYACVGKSVAAKLRKMDEIQRIHAEKLISDVLYQGLLGLLDETSNAQLYT